MDAVEPSAILAVGPGGREVDARGEKVACAHTLADLRAGRGGSVPSASSGNELCRGGGQGGRSSTPQFRPVTVTWFC